MRGNGWGTQWEQIGDNRTREAELNTKQKRQKTPTIKMRSNKMQREGVQRKRTQWVAEIPRNSRNRI